MNLGNMKITLKPMPDSMLLENGFIGIYNNDVLSNIDNESVVIIYSNGKPDSMDSISNCVAGKIYKDSNIPKSLSLPCLYLDRSLLEANFRHCKHFHISTKPSVHVCSDLELELIKLEAKDENAFKINKYPNFVLKKSVEEETKKSTLDIDPICFNVINNHFLEGQIFSRNLSGIKFYFQVSPIQDGHNQEKLPLYITPKTKIEISISNHAIEDINSLRDRGNTEPTGSKDNAAKNSISFQKLYEELAWGGLMNLGNPNKSSFYHSGDVDYFQGLVGKETLIDHIFAHGLIPIKFHCDQGFLFENRSKATLIYGPPGVGKTHLINYLYKYYSDLHKKINSDLLRLTSINLGDMEKDIIATFKPDNELPTIVFIDDFHLFCPATSLLGNNRLPRLLKKQLESLHENIFVFATTQDLEAVDKTFIESSIFDTHIKVPPLRMEDRLKFLEMKLKHKEHGLTKDELNDICSSMQDFTIADINASLKKAILEMFHKLIDKEFQKGFKEDISADELISRCTYLDYECIKQAITSISPTGKMSREVGIPHVKWSDIGGYNHIKQALKESVEWPIKYPSLFEDLKVSPPRGVLLYGPPGCSKTMMAKAVATESKMNFVSIKAPEIYKKYVGESEKKIREVFGMARQNSPCIIFIDEIDSIASERVGGGAWVGNRILNQFLAEMDGVNPLNNVVVIGATNIPQALDKAVLRPGRFDRIIYVPLPDAEARKAILSNSLKDKPLLIPDSIITGLETVKINSFNEFLDGFEFLLSGYSGAEIVNICREVSMDQLRQTIRNYEEFNQPLELKLMIKMQSYIDKLIEIKPRTSLDSLEVFEKFNKKITNS